MRVFVTGATGFVGSHLRRALLADGHEVVGFARHVPAPEDGVRWVAGEITDGDALAEGMAECGAVCHLVAIIRERGGATFERVHVDGTARVLEAMGRTGVTRLLHMSALGAGPKPPSEYYRTKWQAEELVRASGMAQTIFRPSIIFGPGDGFISLLARQLRRAPVVPVIGSGAYPFAPVSVQAVCAAFVQALRMNGDTLSRTFELCGPEVLTYEQMLDVLAAHLGARKPRVHVPVWVLRAAIWLGSGLHLPLPITRDQLAMVVQGNVCGEHSAAEVFSLPQVTLAEGIRSYLPERRKARR
jgi:uncharacterized protein YbjT (DUF2867 family)